MRCLRCRPRVDGISRIDDIATRGPTALRFASRTPLLHAWAMWRARVLRIASRTDRAQKTCRASRTSGVVLASRTPCAFITPRTLLTLHRTPVALRPLRTCRATLRREDSRCVADALQPCSWRRVAHCVEAGLAHIDDIVWIREEIFRVDPTLCLRTPGLRTPVCREEPRPHGSLESGPARMPSERRGRLATKLTASRCGLGVLGGCLR